MKLFDDANMTTGSVGGFHFSAVRPETLGATEYTLVTLVLDKTGSVAGFAQDLFSIKKTVVEACRKSPRADYLLLRVVEFNGSIDEVHGFLPLSQVDAAAYQTPRCGGMTALRDAVFSAVGATNAYAKTLAADDYLTNAIIIVGTDGDDNDSRVSAADVAAELKRGTQGESLESMRTILVGVNAGVYRSALEGFQRDVGVDQYVDVADATPQRLAKLAEFVSRSISAQSQSLGTGGPSKALTF